MSRSLRPITARKASVAPRPIEICRGREPTDGGAAGNRSAYPSDAPRRPFKVATAIERQRERRELWSRGPRDARLPLELHAFRRVRAAILALSGPSRLGP